jgi:hypothetical protein
MIASQPLQRRVLEMITLITAMVSYCSGQTIRVPYRVPNGTEKDAIVAASSKKAVDKKASQKTTITRKDTCWLFPLAGSTCAGDTSAKRIDNINGFYGTAGQFSFLNQIKSIYNGASSSATVSADLGSLNFYNGMQLTIGTNVQAGSIGASSATTGTVPTLSQAGAAQATQNMLYGGTVVASAIYPVIAIGASNINSKAGNFGTVVFLAAREGVDVQNFKAGTSVTVNSPPAHTTAGVEGYVQYNSINPKEDTVGAPPIFQGALFAGGSYGYSYTSHDYARDYGFSKVSNGLGQVSFGVLVNGVARITVSRAFGPAQTYIDSTSNTQKTLNNFKTWSFGITYQK